MYATEKIKKLNRVGKITDIQAFYLLSALRKVIINTLKFKYKNEQTKNNL